ncbi:hypothetical protein [Scytonema sp. NUACC26]
MDEDRIAIAGSSFGGIQTVLATEKELGLRATIAFAPKEPQPIADEHR